MNLTNLIIAIIAQIILIQVGNAKEKEQRFVSKFKDIIKIESRKL